MQKQFLLSKAGVPPQGFVNDGTKVMGSQTTLPWQCAHEGCPRKAGDYVQMGGPSKFCTGLYGHTCLKPGCNKEKHWAARLCPEHALMSKEEIESLQRGTEFAFTTNEEFLAVQEYYDEEIVTMPVQHKGKTFDVPVNGSPPCIWYCKTCKCMCSEDAQPHCCQTNPCSLCCGGKFDPIGWVACKNHDISGGPSDGLVRCGTLINPFNGSEEGMFEAMMWYPYYWACVGCCGPQVAKLAKVGNPNKKGVVKASKEKDPDAQERGYMPQYPGDCCYFQNEGWNAKDRVSLVHDNIVMRHLHEERTWDKAMCHPVHCLKTPVYVCCTPCCICMQRKKALNGDMSNYRCFADRYCTLTRYACGAWKEGESKFNIDFALQKCESKPALGLCCEVCCYCQQAALINHEMVWDESAVKTDPCELKLVRLANFDQVWWCIKIAIDLACECLKHQAEGCEGDGDGGGLLGPCAPLLGGCLPAGASPTALLGTIFECIGCGGCEELCACGAIAEACPCIGEDGPDCSKLKDCADFTKWLTDQVNGASSCAHCCTFYLRMALTDSQLAAIKAGRGGMTSSVVPT